MSLPGFRKTEMNSSFLDSWSFSHPNLSQHSYNRWTEAQTVTTRISKSLSTVFQSVSADGIPGRDYDEDFVVVVLLFYVHAKQLWS